jgi:hypothetical protein
LHLDSLIPPSPTDPAIGKLGLRVASPLPAPLYLSSDGLVGQSDEEREGGASSFVNSIVVIDGIPQWEYIGVRYQSLLARYGASCGGSSFLASSDGRS